MSKLQLLDELSGIIEKTRVLINCLREGIPECAEECAGILDYDMDDAMLELDCIRECLAVESAKA